MYLNLWKVRANKLLIKNCELKQENKILKEILKENEFVKVYYDGELEFECLVCGRNYNEGHSSDCIFNKLLNENTKEKINNQIINDGLTNEERIVSDALVSAWNNYLKLSKQHPADLDLFTEGIQKCQQTLFMRILRRDYPKAYSSENNNIKENKYGIL